jgi:hypothetical protein
MNDIKPGKVGVISEAVIDALGLSVLPGTLKARNPHYGFYKNR